MVRLAIQSAPTADLAYTNCVYVHPNDFAALQVVTAPPPPPPHSGGLSARTHHAKTPFDDEGSLVAAVGGGPVGHVNVELLGRVFACKAHEGVKPGTVALSMFQRSFAQAVLDAQVEVKPFSPPPEKFVLGELKFKVVPLRAVAKNSTAAPLEVQALDLCEELNVAFASQVFAVGQKIAHIYKSVSPLQLEVIGLRPQADMAGSTPTTATSSSQFNLSSLGGSSNSSERGLFVPKVTQIQLIKGEGVIVKGQVVERSVNKMLEVNFEALGIGGLDNEFAQIFRRAFASRVYPPEIVKNMGLNHVRGMMLYGPPGCGKTLIARQISKALQGGDAETRREPKVVNGPEILSKFVGESEKNIRELFAEAEAEQAERGDESELHVIIFDEIDAIAKKRGSTRDGTGVHDSLVNQLLSKIDGVDALNNILLIGMTNRLDMLDPALLRPGRFEVQVEISLPDERGRSQILHIHTAKMRKAGYLAEDVDIAALAERTKNYTGAEIEGLVKDAGSWAFQRQVDTSDLRKVVDPKSLRVTMQDFEMALHETKPAFGAADAEEELRRHFAAGIIPFSPTFEHAERMLREMAHRVRQPDRANLSLVSVLLAGEPGSGKTALAAKVASESGFPFIRVISPDKLIGMSEQTKSSELASVFEEAYKSQQSLILLEDVERIIDYSRIGPRFSNQVLQTLLILVRKPPPKANRRLMVMATTSIPELISPLDLVSVFNLVLNVPQVETAEEVTKVARSFLGEESAAREAKEIAQIAHMCPVPISVKKLLLGLEMAQNEGKLSSLLFSEFLAGSSSNSSAS